MTFSEQGVVELIKENFVPVWESVAPVTVATYKLDKDREVKGTINGEIAIYFCRPDGKVFDVLPALQSPEQTLEAMKDALKLYHDSDGAKDWQKVVDHHLVQRTTLASTNTNEILRGELGLLKRAEVIGDAANAPTRDLRVAVGSKSLVAAPTERFITVEPGGKFLYKYRVHKVMAELPAPQSPEELKHTVFEKVLEMPLEGHSATYDTSSLRPFTIIEE